MNKKEKIKLSHSVIEWLSKEITEIEHVIKKLKNPSLVMDKNHELYDLDDLDYLELKLEELNQRSAFEAKNLKRLTIE